MKNKSISLLIITLLVMFPFINAVSQADNLPFHYAEIPAPEFEQALEKSASTCIIPLGIMEKHGAHLPLGTDLFLAREISSRAASLNYTLVFPEYYFGQIFEAKHQPGTIAYSQELIWNILEETCDELSRNGIKKIILVNGHGGNNHFLSYFCQALLEKEKDYVVVFFSPGESEDFTKKLEELRTTDYDGHAGEEETSMMLVTRPDLVHADKAKRQSGEPKDRMKHVPAAYTGIWWYANYPNHYAGDGSDPKEEIGNLIINSRVEQLVELIDVLKKDNAIKDLQNQFYKESKNPLKTLQGM